MREYHEVLVLTTDKGAQLVPSSRHVKRDLPFAYYTSRFDARRAFKDSRRAVGVLRRVLAEFQPDVINIWQASGMPHAVVYACLETQTPILLSIGDYWPSRLDGGDPYIKALRSRGLSWQALGAKLYNRLHPSMRVTLTTGRQVHVAWVSDFMRNHVALPASMSAASEVTVLPPSPHSTTYSAAFRYRRPVTSGGPEILFAGRVTAAKGADFLVECAGLLRERHPGLRLCIAGRCDEAVEARLVALAAKSRLHKSCLQIVGLLSPVELADRFASADLFVMPSIWDEPAGLALLDAASAGAPVVASRSGGMPELLRDGEEALFFTAGDHAGCVEAIEAALRDGVATERRRLRARVRALAVADDYFARTLTALEEIGATRLG
jgi:glycosyltransferase involved in cell wall biosynthesis